MAIYLLKLNFALMLLYGFYRVVMARDTFFGYRRAALMAMVGVSIMVPLLNLQDMFQRNDTVVGMATVYADFVLPAVPVYAPSPVFTWMDAVVWGYSTIVTILLLRFVWQMAGILHLVKHATVSEIDGVRVHLLPQGEGPFSFFRWIFVAPEERTREQWHEILTHECTHVRQWHSLDVVIAELLCVFNWFNPFCWLLRQEVRLNLEYLADEAVLDEGSARKSYQYHLLGLAYHPGRRDLTNNFNVLPLKNRIKMMNKSRTKEIGKAKYVLFIPLAAALLAVSNIELIARNVSAQVPELKLVEAVGKQLDQSMTSPNGVSVLSRPLAEAQSAISPEADSAEALGADRPDEAPQNGKTYDVVEVMPSFPGGPSEMMKYLSQNIKYPKECHAKGIEGRVVVSFVVETDGSISTVNVFRSIDPMLDAEAERVVSAMPKWTPGKQNGKAVRVKYTLPVSFKLDKEDSKSAPQADGDGSKVSILKKVLVIIDDKEVNADQLNSINPTDIASVNVLKGEEAVKRYGEKANDGVILITMKK